MPFVSGHFGEASPAPEAVIGKPRKRQQHQNKQVSVVPSVPPPARLAVVEPAPPVAATTVELSEEAARRTDLVWAGGITAAFLLLFPLLTFSKTAAVPVLVSFALAYALDPVIDWTERRGMSRTLGIFALLAVVAMATAGFLLYLVPAIGDELQKVPEFFRAITVKAIPRIETLIGQQLPTTVRDAAQTLSEKGRGLAEQALPTLADVGVKALGGTATVLTALVGLMVIPVLSFYLLRDYDHIVAWGRHLVPRRYEALVAARFREVDGVLSSFIRGQLTIGAILTCIYVLGLSLAQLDLAVVIGAVAGFGILIPYIGPAVGGMLALVSLAVSWQGPWQIGVMVATFGLASALEGLFLTPRILGEKVGLPALGVMVAILVFGELFGFVGVLLAVPVTASLKVAGQVVLHHYRRSKLYRGEAQ